MRGIQYHPNMKGHIASKIVMLHHQYSVVSPALQIVSKVNKMEQSFSVLQQGGGIEKWFPIYNI